MKLYKKKINFPVSSLILLFSSSAHLWAAPLAKIPPPEGFKKIAHIEPNPEPSFSEKERKRGFSLFTRALTEVIYPNTKHLDWEKIASLSSYGTPGQIITLPFTVYPLENLKDFQVRASELKHKKGACIPRSNITERVVTYWNIRYPRYRSKSSYMTVPELLEKIDKNELKKKRCVRYWIDIKIPSTALPGTYKGNITVCCSRMKKSLVLPVSIKVLGYKLISNPFKKYSVYNYDLHNKIKKTKTIEQKKFWESVAEEEYKAMRDYGIDMMPTLRPFWDNSQNKPVLACNGIAIEKMLKMGFQGPVPISLAYVIRYLYAKNTGIAGSFKHWIVPIMPDDSFYKELTEAIKRFEQDRVARNWPEFVYIPLDEVNPAGKEFGTKCYKAVKDAGVKIFITKDPNASDHKFYEDYIDVWTSQGFALWDKDAKISGKELWAYPNHNSCETRIPEVMTKGGRMTYGYGFWRSSYSVLIPWIWRWDHVSPAKFDYLATSFSVCGNQISHDGKIIPTTYWTCFREGKNDLKYLYTLWCKIIERKNSKSPACQKVIKKAENFMNYVWNKISVQEKYKTEGVFISEEFDSIRENAAILTEALIEFPPTKSKLKTIHPEDFFHTKHTQQENEFNEHNLKKLSLMSGKKAKWIPIGKEAMLRYEKTKYSPNKILEFNVKVDHKFDGGGEQGSFLIGWPRIEYKLKNGTLDLSKYDFIYFKALINSDRDEVEDDKTFLALSILSDTGAKSKLQLLQNAEEKTWQKELIPIKELIIDGMSLKDMKNIKALQIWTAESQFSDKTDISFFIEDIALFSIIKPFVDRIGMPCVISKKYKKMPVTLNVLGKVSSDSKIMLSLTNGKGETVREKIVEPDMLKKRVHINISDLPQGLYSIQINGIDVAPEIKKVEVEIIDSIE